MRQVSFGSYLRELRKAKDPPLTQEMLAEAIGRQKMTISQYEMGKNAPPQGELLERLIDALSASLDEARKLRLLASVQRHTLPSDIINYFYDHPVIYDVIQKAQESGYDDSDWIRIKAYMNDK